MIGPGSSVTVNKNAMVNAGGINTPGPVIFHVVGHSNTGKTALISSWIPHFKARGLRIGIIKSCHGGITRTDHLKDSGAFLQAAGDRIALISPQSTEIILNEPFLLTDMIRRYFADCDAVFVEGFKHEAIGHIILCLRKGVSEELFVPPERLTAVISDYDLPNITCNLKFNDTKSQLTMLEKIMKKNETDVLNIYVNEKSIPVNDFVQKIFTNVIQGMIESLKTEDAEIQSVRIELKMK